MPHDMHMAGDLFGPVLLPGLAYQAEIVDTTEERALVAALAPLPLKPFEFQGWLGKRQVTSFGWRYDFTEARFARAADMPDFLLPLRDRAAVLAGLASEDLVQTLVTRYDPGAGIGWHRDRPLFETVVGISLLSSATIRFRRRTAQGFERFALPAPPRSAYMLAGEARHDWEHSIAPLDETRWSITFRSLSERGRAMGLEGR
jgi:alkylated DNA repair protein (DNA oxidative demethylase)